MACPSRAGRKTRTFFIHWCSRMALIVARSDGLVGKTSFNVRNAPHALYQAFITYHDGASRRSPDGQILRLISHVVEALFAEARNQRGALALAGQVLHAVAGYYAVE